MLAGKREERVEANGRRRAREIEKALRTEPLTPCNFFKIGAARAGILAAKLIIAGLEGK
jgi:predicted secreted Zn-dependent protease